MSVSRRLKRGLSRFAEPASVHRLSAILLVLAFQLWVPITNAGTFIGRVVGVADGDTITVLDGTNLQHKIRLAGIDAPEKKQPFGYRSTASLAELTFGRQVTIETDKRDRYGRDVGKVLWPCP